MNDFSPLQMARGQDAPELPNSLKKFEFLTPKMGENTTSPGDEDLLRKLFPRTYGQPKVTFDVGPGSIKGKPMKVGVVFSGGQAPGGHNVIIGLYDALQKCDPASRLIGFKGGVGGILKNQTIPLDGQLLKAYRNQGGFDLLGSGRTKLDKEEHLKGAATTIGELKLDGLVIIGGDDSNTNAALLAEYFRQKEIPCQVIGVPKTIDGDLRHPDVAISFGFDTACKIYSEMIGNLCRDCLSAKKYTHFIKLMGRSASHIALECAMQTHPNITFIGEEVAARGQGLHDITAAIADIIEARSAEGKDYGVVLIPEGLIEFIPEVGLLINELNSALGTPSAKDPISSLSPPSRKCFDLLPKSIQEQLLFDRDPHGNVQVALIATEQLLISTVTEDLKRRKEVGQYQGKFQPLAHYFGYEGRCGLPSWFDANYCYSLGMGSVLLLQAGLTGYMIGVSQLERAIEEWKIVGIPLTSMISMEKRLGKDKAVIQKALVDLNSKAFADFAQKRQKWALEDAYRFPGPIQFYGDRALTHSIPLTISY